jgi:hypothetical protein
MLVHLPHHRLNKPIINSQPIQYSILYRVAPPGLTGVFDSLEHRLAHPCPTVLIHSRNGRPRGSLRVKRQH